MTTPKSPDVPQRRGFTLGELLITLTLTVAVFASAVPFMVLQLRQVAQDVGRTDAQQTARYAQNTVDRELRNIGIGVQPLDPSQGIPRNQPKIVQAHGFAVTFNTDLIATDTSDVEAVYYDPNVDPLLTVAMTAGAFITLPYASKTYPDYTYRKPDGSQSLAETISYWASVDSSAGVANEYILWRRVNNGPVTIVARGIYIAAGQPLFRYSRVFATGKVDSIPTSALPIYWDQAGGLADSIRTASLTVNGVFRGYDLQNKATTFMRTVNSQTSLANMGLSQRASCGDVPLNPGAAAAAIVTSSGATSVQVTWGRSPDETGGERDVERYVVFRRAVGNPWGEPVDQKGKSGSTTYMWEDFNLQPGVAFEYGVVAQDCSPTNSSMMVTAPITHP